MSSDVVGHLIHFTRFVVGLRPVAVNFLMVDVMFFAFVDWFRYFVVFLAHGRITGGPRRDQLVHLIIFRRLYMVHVNLIMFFLLMVRLYSSMGGLLGVDYSFLIF